MKSKPIQGFESYIVYEDGRVYSNHCKRFIAQSPTTTYKGDTPLKSFKSCLEASRYFHATYGGSLTSMHKYRKVGCFHIKCNDYSQ